jgi:hypothetical protein
MSDLHYTSQDVSNAISNAEQLSLALASLVDTLSNLDEHRDSISPLIFQLHSDIELLSTIHTCVLHGLKPHST